MDGFELVSLSSDLVLLDLSLVQASLSSADPGLIRSIVLLEQSPVEFRPSQSQSQAQQSLSVPHSDPLCPDL